MNFDAALDLTQIPAMKMMCLLVAPAPFPIRNAVPISQYEYCLEGSEINVDYLSSWPWIDTTKAY
jgi:hypothetical protein